jgi:hypothetical protein
MVTFVRELAGEDTLPPGKLVRLIYASSAAPNTQDTARTRPVYAGGAGMSGQLVVVGLGGCYPTFRFAKNGARWIPSPVPEAQDDSAGGGVLSAACEYSIHL